jgi:hypothetical protein
VSDRVGWEGQPSSDMTWAGRKRRRFEELT